MTNDDLRELLETLRRNLANSSTMDAQVAEKMRLLADEIQSQTIQSAPLSGDDTPNPTLSERVHEFIDDFQTVHPQLTANLSLIAERLADMGI